MFLTYVVYYSYAANSDDGSKTSNFQETGQVPHLRASIPGTLFLFFVFLYADVMHHPNWGC